jgi:hypothetical protein
MNVAVTDGAMQSMLALKLSSVEDCTAAFAESSNVLVKCC